MYIVKQYSCILNYIQYTPIKYAHGDLNITCPKLYLGLLVIPYRVQLLYSWRMSAWDILFIYTVSNCIGSIIQ